MERRKERAKEEEYCAKGKGHDNHRINMLISCKCLNFIATSNNHYHQPHHHQPQQVRKVPEALAVEGRGAGSAPSQQLSTSERTAVGEKKQQAQPSNSDPGNNNTNNNNNNNQQLPVASGNNDSSLLERIKRVYLQRYPRNFIFYSQCMDFFQQVSNSYKYLFYWLI